LQGPSKGAQATVAFYAVNWSRGPGYPSIYGAVPDEHKVGFARRERREGCELKFLLGARVEVRLASGRYRKGAGYLEVAVVGLVLGADDPASLPASLPFRPRHLV
jgi:hypothetical protein